MNKKLLRILISIGIAITCFIVGDLIVELSIDGDSITGDATFILFADLLFLCYPLGNYLRDEHEDSKLLSFLGMILKIVGYAALGLFLLFFLGGLDTRSTPMSYMQLGEDRRAGNNVLMIGGLAMLMAGIFQIFFAEIWPLMKDKDKNVAFACNGQLLLQPLFLLVFGLLSVVVDIRYLTLLVFNVAILFIFLAYIADDGSALGAIIMLAVPFLINLFTCIFAFGGKEGILANQFYFTCSAFFFLALIASLIFWAIVNWFMVDDSKGLFVLMVLVIGLSFGFQFLILNYPMSVFFVILGMVGLIILIRFIYKYFLALILAIGGVLLSTVCPPFIALFVLMGILAPSSSGGSSGSSNRIHISSDNGKINADIVERYVKDEIDRGFFTANPDDLYDIFDDGNKVIIAYNAGQYGTIMESRIKDAIRNMRSDNFKVDNIILRVKR